MEQRHSLDDFINYRLDNKTIIKTNGVIYGILALLFGYLGIHKFYAGFIGKGSLYIIFSWTGIPGLIAFFTAIKSFINVDKNYKITLNRQSKILTLTNNYYYNDSKRFRKDVTDSVKENDIIN